MFTVEKIGRLRIQKISQFEEKEEGISKVIQSVTSFITKYDDEMILCRSIVLDRTSNTSVRTYQTLDFYEVKKKRNEIVKRMFRDSALEEIEEECVSVDFLFDRLTKRKVCEMAIFRCSSLSRIGIDFYKFTKKGFMELKRTVSTIIKIENPELHIGCSQIRYVSKHFVLVLHNGGICLVRVKKIIESDECVENTTIVERVFDSDIQMFHYLRMKKVCLGQNHSNDRLQVVNIENSTRREYKFGQIMAIDSYFHSFPEEGKVDERIVFGMFDCLRVFIIRNGTNLIEISKIMFPSPLYTKSSFTVSHNCIGFTSFRDSSSYQTRRCFLLFFFPYENKIYGVKTKDGITVPRSNNKSSVCTVVKRYNYRKRNNNEDYLKIVLFKQQQQNGKKRSIFRLCRVSGLKLENISLKDFEEEDSKLRKSFLFKKILLDDLLDDPDSSFWNDFSIRFVVVVVNGTESEGNTNQKVERILRVAKTLLSSL